MDLQKHLAHQSTFSVDTFGPGERTKGVSDHVRKELKEIAAAPAPEYRAAEWVDVVILGLDGLWRALATAYPYDSPDALAAKACAFIVSKQSRNEARTWPDWRTMSPDRAIEHVRNPREAEARERESAGPFYDNIPE